MDAEAATAEDEGESVARLSDRSCANNSCKPIPATEINHVVSGRPKDSTYSAQPPSSTLFADLSVRLM